MSNFSIWLKNQMSKRQWGNNETGRQSGLSHTTIGKLLSGRLQPSLSTVTALANAFGEPVNSVLHIAGLVAPVNGVAIDPELYEFMKHMSAAEQAELLAIAKVIKERQKGYKP